MLNFPHTAPRPLEATTATRPKDLEGSLSILGGNGTVEIGGFAVNEMKVWQFADQTDDDTTMLARMKEAPPNVYGFGHGAYLNNVVQTINGNGSALVDGLEGRKSLELISAIYESIAAEREVVLRFQTHHARLGQRVAV